MSKQNHSFFKIFTLAGLCSVVTVNVAPLQAQSPRPLNLMRHHADCSSTSRSQDPACMAAIHRACNQLAPSQSGGLAQEVGADQFTISCFERGTYVEASPSQTSTFHEGCDDLGKSQTPACLAAVSRLCDQVYDFGGGLVQEVGNGVFGIACFEAERFDVAVSDLTSFHSNCAGLQQSRDPACVSAMHRFCSEIGYGGGVSQEVGNGRFSVACFDSVWRGDVRVGARR